MQPIPTRHLAGRIVVISSLCVYWVTIWIKSNLNKNVKAHSHVAELAWSGVQPLNPSRSAEPVMLGRRIKTLLDQWLYVM